MALVKSSKIGPGAAKTAAPKAAEKSTKRAPTAKAANGGRREKVSERIGAATEQLASGLTEASAAAEELRRSMEQIAAGAEEAAGASQEQLGAVRSIASTFATSRMQAETSKRRTELVQTVLGETAAQINASVRAVERNSERQAATVASISELERRARAIGEITVSVSRISDQTNLLALNAAIEAARAGEHGRGFAVVAEEVRSLAETSDKSAVQVKEFAESIQAEVQTVARAIGDAAKAAIEEVRSGAAVVETLTALRADMVRIATASDDTLTTALQAERASTEAQKGAEQVAAAAEQQSAAAEEAQAAIKQQAQALDQGQQASQALALLAEELNAGKAQSSAAQEIAAAAEELSATIQELSGAAAQIKAAVEQINKGSQLQAAATQETSAALAQINTSAAVAQRNATTADETVKSMEAALRESRAAVEKLVRGVNGALEETRGSLATIVTLETVARRIEKSVEGIALVAMQTTMLAVSGSVEAARAGEAGTGFALVSSDIRALAREASDSADGIKDTVRGILDQIAALRRDLEQTIAIGELEVQNNRAVLASLEKLDGDVEGMRAANAAILEAADILKIAATEMEQGAQNIAAAAEEANAASRQAAIASSQQAQGAEDLAAAIEEIASLADALRQ